MKYLFLLLFLTGCSCTPEPKVCEEHIYTVTKIGQCIHLHRSGNLCSVMLDDLFDIRLNNPSVEGAKLRKCNGIYERVK
jgi:hypothetical protein